MASNFAPYQDAPELERARSPPLKSPPSSVDYSRAQSPPLRPSQTSRNISDITSQTLPAPDTFANTQNDGSGYEQGGRERNLEAFQTSIPMRLDYLAMLAYIGLPPAGGVLLLLLEHKSDYVRFHAWQGSLTFAAVFLLHLILSWSKALSWMLFILDLLLITFLARHAYTDVDTLDHFELPFFGRLANRFVDDE
ncbi:hypothetical protein LTR70_000480 [Exophiala xenobiotica]|uniref:Uncharacterized protein n=1 Tax=Lithohypha guttulata TaxID=1690604 RepID=A0ABR0K0X4_9EURO|nr:hypothetical protein LTR24_008389 [Lithohypha guttulata]KAK5330650.1 hypothetical protein LTR70_000480 [Exophiala xenobiotica]